MIDFIIDKLMWIIGAVLILALIGFIYQTIETNKHCSKWENKIVHQNSYTQFVFTGKVMVPIYHPERDIVQPVCIEPK